MSTPTFTMGTDPEFVILDREGRLVQASEYLPRGGHGPGLDPNEMGTDGHAWTAELRPPPGSPEEITNHIKRILKENYKKLPKDSILKAGSFVSGKSLGGHIHYSFKPQDELVSALDGVLSQFVSCIENQDEGRRRRYGQYGKLGDVRPQPHGFEYRTPASFIVSPSVTLGILALAKAIAWEEKVDGPMSRKKLKGRFNKLLKVDENRYNNCDRGHFISLMPDLWMIIRQYEFWKTDEGKRLWRHVAALRNIAKYPTGWDNGHGMLERWGIVKPKAIKIATKKAEKLQVPNGRLDDRELWNLMMQIPANVEPAPAEHQRVRVEEFANMVQIFERQLREARERAGV